MSARSPADQAVRDRVIHELDSSFLLEAGAGSGKTAIIVARIAHLLRQGCPLTQIAAITFTEKAAGELRERVRIELGASGLHAALRDVDAAPIQTIHAFCANLLREHAIEAGIDPDFRVLDQLQTDLRFAQSWRSWLWSRTQEPSLQRSLQHAFELGLDISDLRFAAEQISRHRDLDEDYAHGDHPDDAEPPGDTPGDSTAEQDQRDHALAGLLSPLRRFIDADARQRRQDGALNYDDLLIETRDLLVWSASARDALRRQYRTIMIDEFQDTDPLQAEIAMLLAAEPDTDDWTQALPGPGRLVLAGDPKQSIYRFRRADIDIYEQVRNRFLAAVQADVVSLSVNFRTRPQLCAWHNQALPNVLAADPQYQRAQARWEPTTAHRHSSAGGAPTGGNSSSGAAAVVTIPAARRFGRVGEAREAEAGLLANLIMYLRQPDAAFGAVSDEDSRRPPRYRDIGVLLRTRTGAQLYTAAFDRAGIPYHFDSGQGFYQQPEIRAVAQLLQALDDPTDEVAILSLLKSPLGAASDAELWQWRASPEESRLAARASELASLRARVRGLNLPELVDQAIHDSGLLHAQAVGASPAQMHQRQANLRMLVQRAAQFADQHNDALRPFVRWLAQRGVRNLPESESSTTEADDDAVRMLTIHQAKGLEFPIVILPKLQDQPPMSSDLIVDRQRQRLEFSIGAGQRDQPPFRTPGYTPSLRRERAYADAESRRMFYVAATRARDWLVLPSFPADSLNGRGSFHSYLDDAVPDWRTPGADRRVMVMPPRTFDAVPGARPELHIAPHDELRSQWRECHQAGLDGGIRQIETQTPSQLHSDAPANSVDTYSHSESNSEALALGAAVHAALEVANFRDLESTRQRTSDVCRRRGAPFDLVYAHVERAARSEIMQRAAVSPQALRELPLVSVQHDDEHVAITEGIADLLFQDQGRWVLVDYKSDAAPLSSARRAQYERQVLAYAAMLQRAQIKIDEAYLLLTASGDALPVALP